MPWGGDKRVVITILYKSANDWPVADGRSLRGCAQPLRLSSTHFRTAIRSVTVRPRWWAKMVLVEATGAEWS
jgi:hypothetical protein